MAVALLLAHQMAVLRPAVDCEMVTACFQEEEAGVACSPPMPPATPSVPPGSKRTDR